MDIRISDFYRPNERQRLFHASPAKYRLFGGAAGPGKTTALVVENCIQAHAWPGGHTLLLRRTFPELEGSLLREFRQRIPRELYDSFNESKHIVNWKCGSTTKFGYCQSEKDVYQYQGDEFVFIGVDELTHLTLSQWQYLSSRNRCPIPGSFSNMAGATNPGNIGHAWVKALWIDHQPAPGMDANAASRYDSSEYDFINARLEHNPVYANDLAYKATLEMLPTALREALLNGNWNVFAGQYFDNFDPAKQVRDKRTDYKIEYWYPKWISIDWGFQHAAAIYWGCQLGRQVVTYRELVRTGMAPREMARLIAEMSVQDDGKPEEIDAIYLSPDAFAKRTDEDTIAEQIGDELVKLGLPRPQRADDDRIGGWMLMYQMLGAEPEPAWIIDASCEVLIQSLPLLIRDLEKHPEDVLKKPGDVGDDAADSARYLLKSRIAPGRMPFELRVAARVTSPDPTIRAIQAKKAIITERKKDAPVHFARHRRGFKRR